MEDKPTDDAQDALQQVQEDKLLDIQGNTGRNVALKVLDFMLNKRINRKRLLKGLQEKLKEDPLGFFKEIVMPLLPREKTVGAEVNIGLANLTPDQLVLAMDQATAPQTRRPRVRLQEIMPREDLELGLATQLPALPPPVVDTKKRVRVAFEGKPSVW